jgi:uncharacterized protein (TIGR00369 family)
MTQTIFDNLPLPPVARLLGWKLLAVNPEGGTIEVEFQARAEFLNPSGFVQGGLIAAMLDDTLGPAVFAKSGGQRMTTTIDLHVHYVRPVRPGCVTTTAKVVNLGSRVAFVEGRLFDHEGRLAATATASAMLADYRPG